MSPTLVHNEPPYPPSVWSLGGISKRYVDIPITAVFLALFIIGAATHMTIFQLNKRRGHKFLFNLFLFAFCMARIVTCILRIASTSLPTNIRLGIAAQIFVAAGVLIIFLINLIWSHRLLRSIHPKFGWHRLATIVIRSIYVLLGATLIIVITATVQSLYTLDRHIRSIDRSLQLFGSTCLAIISTLPLLILAITFTVPRRSRPDKFGIGRQRTKVTVLLTGSFLISLGAWYRCGTSWRTPIPRSQPLPGYYSKACFYLFNFVVEILTVYLYAIVRVDLRFHVPDGSSRSKSYAAVATTGSPPGTDADKERQRGQGSGDATDAETEERSHEGKMGLERTTRE